MAGLGNLVMVNVTHDAIHGLILGRNYYSYNLGGYKIHQKNEFERWQFTQRP